MADFVLAKKKSFTFSMEGNEKVYEIPPITKLSLDDLKVFQKMQSGEMMESYEMAREFILRFLPELDGQLGDYEFMQVFGAYAKSQNNMGES